MSVDDLINMEPIPELPPPSERVRLRKRFGFTQAGLARKIGISPRSFYRWETGKDIQFPTDPKYLDYVAVIVAWKETEQRERRTQ
jgi:transcriptional regulator with XRE-family HTH domain